jgi:hypothetical protein
MVSQGVSMDPILSTLISWQLVFFSLGVAAGVFVIRKIVEYLMANHQFFSKESKLWTELLLPILPIFLGASCAILFKMFPYPSGLVSWSGRFIFGLVAGFLSSTVYRVMNALLGEKIGAVVSAVTSRLPNAGK